MARRRKDQASLDMVEAVEPAIVDAAEVAAPPVEADVLPGGVEDQEEASAEIANPTKWLVLEDQTVSLFGQMTLLPAGTVVSVASYGPSGIKRIMEQGVLLEPVA